MKTLFEVNPSGLSLKAFEGLSRGGDVHIDESFAPSVSHSGTSKEGAEKAANAPTQAALVLSFLKARGAKGATDEEIAAHYPDVRESDLRRARVELWDANLVGLIRLPDAHNPCPNGKRRGYCKECVVTRQSSHGVAVAVWKAV